MNSLHFKRLNNPTKRRKYFSTTSLSDSAECTTEVSKSFIYRVSPAFDVDAKAEKPRVYIKKVMDSNTKEERFTLRVKGAIYVTQDRKRLKVDFHHTLNIVIQWKVDVFSPKKSEALT